MTATTDNPFRVEYDRRGFLRARKRIHELAERAGNATSAWNAFLDWFAHANRQQFGSRGVRYGTPWKELAPSTVDDKRYLGYQTDILIRDSTLLRSVADRPLDVERFGPHDMTAGTSVSYAKYHHYGAVRSRLPRRPLWSTDRIKSSGVVTSALRTWIVNGNAQVTERGRR